MHVLGIFVKHPMAGQVKTRLAKDIGEDRAARLYEAFTADVVARFRQITDRRFLCYAPNTDIARNHFEVRFVDAGGKMASESAGPEPCPRGYQLWPQPDSPLGQRLEQFFAQQFDNGATRVVVI